MSVKNRCYGCQHFGGFRGKYNGNSTIVQCDIGMKGVSISQGCSSYTPDNTASCKGMSVCFYNKNKTMDNIECDIHGYIGNNRDYCPDHAALEEDPKAEKKGGCFVTTAVCDVLGKNDNCFELETLRRFRDKELLPHESLKQLVFDYYEISPKLVKKIMNSNKRDEFAHHLLHEHINVIIEKIQNNDKFGAIKLYEQMVDKISRLEER